MKTPILNCTISLLVAASSAFSQIYLSGPVSGILEDTTYIVEDDITVLAGTELIIEPGAVFYFSPECDFNIHGLLSAAGAEADSIIFLRRNPDQPWGHIVFYDDCHDSSAMTYCLISGGYASPYNSWPYNCGGGILCIYSSPAFEHCKISENHAGYCGGGLAFYLDSYAVLNECLVNGNQADNDGGGIQCFNSSPTIINSIIEANTAVVVGGGISCGESAPIIRTCLFQSNNSGFSGGGFFCDRSFNIIINNCQFLQNHSDGPGGGITIGQESSIIKVDSCDIIGNSAAQGGGIFCDISTVEITRCLLYADSASGNGGSFACNYGTISFNQCTICKNFAADSAGAAYVTDYSYVHWHNSIVDNNYGQCGVFVDNTSDLAVDYCDVFANENGNFSGNIPHELGFIVNINANGDSCDTFYNIFLDPLYFDPLNGDFHLTENSPCIDAGDPTSPLDPDSTIADIGVYYFDQSTVVEDPTIILHPSTFILSAYPNPFNSITAITFVLNQDAEIKLAVYNVLGQEVAEFGKCNAESGKNTVVWDASGQASGMYFVRLLVDGGQSVVRKVVLLK